MKKIIFEYFLIPLAVKSYMLIGSALYKARKLKETISNIKFSSDKAKIKPSMR